MGAGTTPSPSSLQTQHHLLPKILHKMQQDFPTGWFGPWQRDWDWILSGSKCEQGLGQLDKELK